MTRSAPDCGRAPNCQKDAGQRDYAGQPEGRQCEKEGTESRGGRRRSWKALKSKEGVKWFRKMLNS